MQNTRDPFLTQFTRRLAIETPEHVVVELELAGIGSRLAAAALDVLILTALFFGLGLASSLARHLLVALGRGWASALLLFAAFLLFWGYFVLFEALSNGRTPGKRYLGLRVVMDTGHPITFAAAATRNLLRIVDSQPLFSYFVGLLFVLLHRQNKRLGDLVAGTIVVRDRPGDIQLGRPAALEPEPLEAGAPELTDDEYRLLGQFLDRLESLAPAQRTRLTRDLLHRFGPRFPRRDPDPETFLVQLYGEELGKRRGRFATRAGAGVGRTTVAAERFVSRKLAGWEQFRGMAAEAERQGLQSLGPSAIPGFAARYREVAADLARARTYSVDPRVLGYLERLVATGHNALYGLRGARRRPLGRLLLREWPAAIVEARAYVLAALLLFTVPGAAGYLLIRERPQAATEVLPDRMIARAEAGLGRRSAGVGYAEAPDPFLPIIASQIVANNVQVAFGVFAFGVTAGIGTVLLLVFNGLFFGTVLGLFANYGLADWILIFVAGHGVLELTAIFIAGGAGLLVARALVAPGDVTRRDALVVHGRRAIKLVGAAVLLLLLAGTIEGFLSASDTAAPWKIGVSAASAVLLALYLWNGVVYLRRQSK
ncbi:MAG: stage II sporulation protein M [Gemmatimonadales bacterium]